METKATAMIQLTDRRQTGQNMGERDMVGPMGEYYGTLINTVPAFENLVLIAVNQHDALVAQVAAWKKAIEGLTPSGSEFVDDPEACAAFIRETYHPVKQFKNLREQVAKLQEALDSLIGTVANWNVERCGYDKPPLDYVMGKVKAPDPTPTKYQKELLEAAKRARAVLAETEPS